MGGLVFDFETSDDDTPPFIPNYQRLTLTARGVSLLAKCGYLPDISKRKIVDKSKADAMAKLLVILQAGWMLVQVIGRLVTGLPVTLLEANTLDHVLCAFIIYLLWWHKPRSIMMPTKLGGDWVKPICAYMHTSSQISDHDSEHPGSLKRPWKDSELSRFAYLSPEISQGLQEEHQSNSTSSISKLYPQSEKAPNFEFDTEATKLYKTAKTSEFGSFVPSTSHLNANGASKREPDQAKNTQYLLNANPEQQIRWQLAAQAIHTHPSRFITHTIPSSSRAPTHQIRKPLIELLLSPSAGNWPGEDLLRSTRGLVMGMTLWLASIAFGAVHARSRIVRLLSHSL